LAIHDVVVADVNFVVSSRVAMVLVAMGCALVAHAQPSIFKEADLTLGQALIATHQCEACHARRVGGDGSDVYDPGGRIKTAALLRGMVEYCNTQLNLGMFPEEVSSVAAVINQRHYKFK
jgi:hypothetical protein